MKQMVVIGLILTPIWVLCQSNSKKEVTNAVFFNLIQAYANAKSAPELKIIPSNTNKYVTARYIIDDGSHRIEIGEKLINICFSMGKDSLNALAIILAHELAHYYNDHEWCSDYAYALAKTNLKLATEINTSSLSAKKEKETLADNHGLFYASVAGYSVFECYEKVLNKVYSSYKLPQNLPGYPSLVDRKKIARDACIKSNELYGYFKVGIKAMEEKKYDKAILAFEKSNSKIPYRENFNNLGVAKTRKALEFRVTKDTFEISNPDRFLYPLELENKSRLNQVESRNIEDLWSTEGVLLLKEARRYFQESIRIDPDFLKGHINLACVYDLLGNYPKAIGEIMELPIELHEITEVKRILAIALYHNNQKEKAIDIWKNIKSNSKQKYE